MFLLVFILGAWFYFFRDKAVEGVFEGSGTVRGTEVTVSSRVPGRVEEFLVKEGRTVEAGAAKGQTLFAPFLRLPPRAGRFRLVKVM